jgi:branched-chain amino acid transport system substrate-binding protein
LVGWWVAFPKPGRLGLLLCAGLLAGACRRPPPPPIQIGLVTYDGSGLNGTPTSNAVRLAAEEVNRGGGLLLAGRRHPIEFQTETIREGSPEEAVAAVQKLINQGKVSAIIGPQNSAEAVPAGGVADRSGIPLISPLSSHPLTTLGRPFVFRVCVKDAVEGAVLAAFARETLKARTAALLVEERVATSRTVAEAFRREFLVRGGRIVADHAITEVTEGTAELEPVLRQIKRSQADVLLIPNYQTTTLQIGRAARRAGIRSIFLGPDSWSRRHLLAIPEFDGAYMMSNWSAELPSAENARFVGDYARRFGSEPTETAALTYDAAKMLFAAIAATPDGAPAAIQKALAGSAGFLGTTGLIRYSGTGDPEKASLVLQFRGGRAIMARQVALAEGR